MIAQMPAPHQRIPGDVNGRCPPARQQGSRTIMGPHITLTTRYDRLGALPANAVPWTTVQVDGVRATAWRVGGGTASSVAGAVVPDGPDYVVLRWQPAAGLWLQLAGSATLGKLVETATAVRHRPASWPVSPLG
jgi:hypothetical protein